MARFDETFVSQSVHNHLTFKSYKTNHALALLHIHLVAEHDLLPVSVVFDRALHM